MTAEAEHTTTCAVLAFPNSSAKPVKQERGWGRREKWPPNVQVLREPACRKQQCMPPEAVIVLALIDAIEESGKHQKGQRRSISRMDVVRKINGQDLDHEDLEVRARAYVAINMLFSDRGRYSI